MLCGEFFGEKILGCRRRPILSFLLAFSRGFWKKWVFEGWFFDGKNVVECVVKRGGKTAFFGRLKTRHFFELYFFAFPNREQI